jgi:plastocyanin
MKEGKGYMKYRFGSRLGAALAASVAALLLLSFACGGDDDDDDGGRTASPTQSGAASPSGNGGGGEVTLDISMGDNFYEYEGEKNPTISLPAGAEVTINLTNDGTAIHNMRSAGDDNSFNTSDDAVSDPDFVSAGQTATLEFTAPSEAGTYKYQCDLHPTDMKGEFEVE